MSAPPAPAPDKPEAEKLSDIRPKVRYLQIALWGGLLTSVLLIGAWGFFSKPGDRPLSVQAQLEPNNKLYWKQGFPRIGGAITLGNAKAATVTATQFAFEGWGKAKFVFDLFGAAPLMGATPDVFRVPTLELDSHVDLDTAQPARLRILFYRGATWRAFERGNATLLISSLSSQIEPRDSIMHGLVDITGIDSSKFRLTTGNEPGCSPECTGTFSDFNGSIFLTDPPSYGGPGARNITRVIVNGSAHAGSRVTDYNHGFTLFAVQPAEFHIDEYAEEAEFRANRGSLTFNGQLFPLGPAAPLKVRFSETNPARLEISTGDMAVLRLDGTANEVHLGDDDLMPRRIDAWGWYWQLLLGAVLSFSGERLFGLLRSPHRYRERR